MVFQELLTLVFGESFKAVQSALRYRGMTWGTCFKIIGLNLTMQGTMSRSDMPGRIVTLESHYLSEICQGCYLGGWVQRPSGIGYCHRGDKWSRHTVGGSTPLLNLGDMIIIAMKLWVIEVTEVPNMSIFLAHHVDRFTEFLKTLKIIFMGSIVSC